MGVEEWRKKLAENDFKAPTKEDNYGQELILDLKDCNVSKFNRKDLEEYCIQICNLTKMQRADIHFWDSEGDEEQYNLFYEEAPHLCGTSLIQFITTSNITIHTIDPFQKMYINLFTCKPFNPEEAVSFTEKYFEGKIIAQHNIVRK